jgi:hypothetical protein
MRAWFGGAEGLCAGRDSLDGVSNKVGTMEIPATVAKGPVMAAVGK